MSTILLLAFYCQPGRGSEYGMGWNWATGLAEDNDVYVLTHPSNREAIEAEPTSRPNQRLRFVYVELPSFLDPWERLWNEERIHLRYTLWQFAAFFAGLRLRRRVKFDLVQLASWGTLDGLTFGWALGAPFVFGPVGGAQRAPWALRRHLGPAWRSERLRNLRVHAASLNPLTRAAVRRSAVALASNHETFAELRALGARDVRMVPGVAVDPAWAPETVPERPARGRPVVLWVSRLLPRKAPTLAIEAFARARARQPLELWIVGDGALMAECRGLAERLGVADGVRFVGRASHAQVARYMAESDIFLFTSLRDTFPETALEAMAWGLPVVSLDHQGLKLLPDDAVLKVPPDDPEGVVDGLADALVALASDADRRRAMGEAGRRSVRREHLWPHRVDAMRDVHRDLVGQRAVASL